MLSYFNNQKECSKQRVQSGRDVKMKQIALASQIIGGVVIIWELDIVITTNNREIVRGRKYSVGGFLVLIC